MVKIALIYYGNNNFLISLGVTGNILDTAVEIIHFSRPVILKLLFKVKAKTISGFG